MKNYNNSTGQYKIDIFRNGKYLCSTDMASTCKGAVKRIRQIRPELENDKITAHFWRSGR